MKFFAFSASIRLRRTHVEFPAEFVEPSPDFWQKISTPDQGFTQWSSSPRTGEDSDGLREAMKADLDWLETKKDFFETFVQTSGTAEYVIDWFASTVSGGGSLLPSLLQRMSDLKIDLTIVVSTCTEKISEYDDDLMAAHAASQQESAAPAPYTPEHTSDTAPEPRSD